jgi:hypothetical protein
MTTVPENWIPFVAVPARPNQPAGSFEVHLEEEEVPREGIVVRRTYQYARTPDGRAFLWAGRSKRPGRGEGASGLRFDAIVKKRG